MSVLDDIFAAQRETPDLMWGRPTPADVTSAAAMIGWLSDADSPWIPLAVAQCQPAG